MLHSKQLWALKGQGHLESKDDLRTYPEKSYAAYVIDVCSIHKYDEICKSCDFKRLKIEKKDFNGKCPKCKSKTDLIGWKQGIFCPYCRKTFCLDCIVIKDCYEDENRIVWAGRDKVCPECHNILQSWRICHCRIEYAH